MQLRDDFAKHISELQAPLDKPYSKKIDCDLFKSDDDTHYLNKQIHDVNPDYLTFLPDFFWYFYFCIGWVYFSSFWLGNYFLQDIGEVVFIQGKFVNTPFLTQHHHRIIKPPVCTQQVSYH